MSQFITTINGCDIVTVDREGEIYVPIKPICEAFGVNYTSQHEKLKNDFTFSGATVPLRGIVAADGKEREMVCLPLVLVYLWLGTINPANVSETARDRVIAYRLECAQALYDHFRKKAARATEQAQLEAALLAEKLKCETAIKETKAQVRRIDEKLSQLQNERLNPNPSLF